jgi:hypothetical protein
MREEKDLDLHSVYRYIMCKRMHCDVYWKKGVSSFLKLIAGDWPRREKLYVWREGGHKFLVFMIE